MELSHALNSNSRLQIQERESFSLSFVLLPPGEANNPVSFRSSVRVASELVEREEMVGDADFAAAIETRKIKPLNLESYDSDR